MALDPTKLDKYAESATEAAKLIARSWKSLLVTCFLSGIVAVPVLAYNSREVLLPILYQRFAKGTEAPNLVNEWNLVSPATNPEFYNCQSNKCTPDENKRFQISQALKGVIGDTGAEIALFTIYGDGYRQIVAQEVAPGNIRISKSFWIAPIDSAGFSENLAAHRQGQCNTLMIEELDPESYLNRAFVVYKIRRLKTCPVARSYPFYELVGYVSLSFKDEEIPPESEVEAGVTKAVKRIEAIMGYSGDPSYLIRSAEDQKQYETDNFQPDSGG